MFDTPIKLYYCDNCGGKHIGYWENWGAWDTGPEWSFVATDWKGNKRKPEGWSRCLSLKKYKYRKYDGRG